MRMHDFAVVAALTPAGGDSRFPRFHDERQACLIEDVRAVA